MTTFIVEHLHNGHPMFDSVTGVEDIDLTMFKDIQTLWVCDTKEEIEAVESELRKKHARRS
jgi:alpha-galactosidase